MTHDDIIRMAREAGFECFQWQKDGAVEVVFDGCEGPVTEQMKRFADLVAADASAKAAAAEREACIALCEARAKELLNRPLRRQHHHGAGLGASQCADDIRARGAA